MENNQNTPDLPQDEAWLDELLGQADPVSEIGPDEQAMSGARLTRPEDAEVERIVQETLSQEATQESGADSREQPQTAPISDDATQKFIPQEAAKKVPASTKTPHAKRRPPRKLRPKRAKGYGLLGIPHILATFVWLAIIVAVGVSLGRILWVCAADLLAFGKPDQQATIQITANDNINTISEKLGKAGLIRYPELFSLYAKATGKDEKIDVGEFKLNARLDYSAMINAMMDSAPSREEVRLTFPEGMTCAQIFQMLEENDVCTVQELEEYAATGVLSEYWFLEGTGRGDKYCLEGFLFPDTYDFYTHDNPRRVLEKFLDAFDDRFTDIMRERLTKINGEFAQRLADRGFDQSYIDSHRITIREVVIIASYIEKETANYEDESFTISSVIYNRLSNPGVIPHLNIDATVLYALGNPDRELTEADKTVDSPYNTYVHTGLTPGPIANPGRACLTAALSPADTGYYYYALDPNTGTHHFSTTYEDHLRFLASLG